MSQADAASATVLAIEQQVKGVFNTVDDDPAQVREWLPYLAESAGLRGGPIRLPKWVAQLLAGEMVKIVTEGQAFSNAKAKRELGWELRYPSWRQGFTDEFAGPEASKHVGPVGDAWAIAREVKQVRRPKD